MKFTDKNSEDMVYIVDDDEEIRNILKNLLESQQYKVKEFEHGYDAIKDMKNTNPRVVLLDYFLPGERAESIISNIHKNSQGNTNIILMSANMHVKVDFNDLGVSEFIRKPFSLDTVFSVVEKYTN